MIKPKPRFWNNDLDNIVFSFHNKFHFYGSILGGFFLGFGYAYAIGITWEVKDGWAYWYDDPRWQWLRDPQPTRWLTFRNYIIRNLILSDKFSFQDAFVWDLSGAIIGQALRWGAIYVGLFEMRGCL